MAYIPFSELKNKVLVDTIHAIVTQIQREEADSLLLYRVLE